MPAVRDCGSGIATALYGAGGGPVGGPPPDPSGEIGAGAAIEVGPGRQGGGSCGPLAGGPSLGSPPTECPGSLVPLLVVPDSEGGSAGFVASPGGTADGAVRVKVGVGVDVRTSVPAGGAGGGLEGGPAGAAGGIGICGVGGVGPGRQGGVSSGSIGFGVVTAGVAPL